MAKKPAPIEERFWPKVDIRGPDDCWPWMASTACGYGQIENNGRVLRAHRVVWELVNGEIPTGTCCLHHCDNPRCVNPSHLFLGTQADNLRDAAEKGRTARGQDHGNAKLTNEDIQHIRSRLRHGHPQGEIASELGVSLTTISSINTGRGWGWLPKEDTDG